jgi:hypothetical protein
LSSKELDDFLARSHKELSIQDFEGKSVPCIEFAGKKFDGILSKVAGKPLAVDTNLNILQDGIGHVFVEMLLTFSYGGIKESVLVNANENVIFFEALAQNTMLAIASKESPDKLFMIQLPKPERAIEALEIIKSGLAKRRDRLNTR